MPRRREVPKRKVIPDPKFGDRLVTKLVNVVMLDGKKSTAEGIVYKAFDLVEQRTQEDPIKVFKRAPSSLRSKSSPAASVVPTSRCRLRFAPTVVSPSACVGFATTPVAAVSAPCMSASPTRSSTQPRAAVAR